MQSRRLAVTWLLMLAAAGWANGASLPQRSKNGSAAKIALDDLAFPQRDLVQEVIDKANLWARGPGESFRCRPEHYQWFLDHPDRAVIAWRRMGARCVSIAPRGPDLFGWSDDTGSEVLWETVFKGPNLRIWFAEGKVKPGPLLPLIPVKAVVVLRHVEAKGMEGQPVVQHQSDLYVHTDNKSAALVTRMLGPSAQRMAEQGLEQLQLFFAGVSWYLNQHPDQEESLLKD